MGGKKVFENIFHLFCLIITAAMSFYCVHKYIENEDMASISFKTFHHDNESIYPTVTLCFYGDGIYNLEKLKNHNVTDSSLYKGFLEGSKGGSERFFGIDFDIVTLGLDEYLRKVYLRSTTRSAKFFTWTKGQKSPFAITFRGYDSKCYAMDFIPNTIIPGLENHHLLIVDLKLDFSSHNHKYGGATSFGIFFHYPKQLLRSNLVWGIKDINSVIESKLIKITIQNIEVTERRNKAKVPCHLEWQKDDEKILEQKVEETKCQPPHWKLNVTFPKCLKRDKLRKLRTPAIRRSDEKFLSKHPMPCKQIETINYHINDNIGYENHGPGYNETKGKIEIKILYNQISFKYIQNVRAFNVESLIGNVGGYIGMCLGYTLLQVPNLFQSIYRAIKKFVIGLCR